MYAFPNQQKCEMRNASPGPPEKEPCVQKDHQNEIADFLECLLTKEIEAHCIQ